MITLVYFVLFLWKCLLLLHERVIATKGVSSNGIGSVPMVRQGDIVEGFKIIERLDYLGYKKRYYIDDSNYNLWAQSMRKLPYIRSDEQLASITPPSPAAEDSLVLLSEIHLAMNTSCIRNGTFCLNEHIFHGGHGDIYKASKLEEGRHFNSSVSYILKRMHIVDQPNIEYCAKREIYFGELLLNSHFAARYVSYFNTSTDYWLVFRDEGVSLQQLLYAMTVDETSVQLKPSNTWHKFRMTTQGKMSMKSILYQIISGVSRLHEDGIVHRDIKLSNILLNTEADPKVLIADFSSAISEAALRLGLYPADGPSRRELTEYYEAPEVRLQSYLCQDRDNCDLYSSDPSDLFAYDSWTVGVLMLEMVLGTPHVFEVDQRAAALIHQRLQRKRLSMEDFERTFRTIVFLTALSEYCIFNPSEQISSIANTDSIIKKAADKHWHRLLGNKCSQAGATTSRSNEPASFGFGEDWNIVREFAITDCQGSAQDTSTRGIRQAIIADIYSSIQPTMRSRQRRADHSASSSSSSSSATSSTSTSSSPTCSDSDFRTAILRRDILGLGYSDEWGIDLLRRLLRWEPHERIGMAEALRHAYFAGPYISYLDGSMHATHEDMIRYNNNYQPPTAGAPTEAEDGDIEADARDSDGGSGAKSSASNAVTEIVGALPVREFLDSISHLDGNIDVQDGFPQLLSLPSMTSELPIDTTNTARLIQIEEPQLEFVCPKCNRKFSSWSGCRDHMRLRQHGKRCLFQPLSSSSSASSSSSSSLAVPRCVTHYSMHPLDPSSGWCDIQGRRRTIEDVHATAYSSTYTYYGVFDGHFGSGTARLASRYLHKRIEQLTSHILNAYYSSTSEAERDKDFDDNEDIYLFDEDGLSEEADGLVARGAHNDQKANWLDVSKMIIANETETHSANCTNNINTNSSNYSSSTADDEALLRSEQTLALHRLKRMNRHIANIEDIVFIPFENENILQGNYDSLRTGNSDFSDADYSSPTDAILTVKDMRQVIIDSFVDIDNELSPTDRSGSTAVILYIFDKYLVSASLGDCRTILCCAGTSHVPIQLTVDHTPRDEIERARVLSRGGFISRGKDTSSIDRVNGVLAVTRSLGDKSLKHVVSSSPDVLVIGRYATGDSVSQVTSPGSSTISSSASFTTRSTDESSSSSCRYYKEAIDSRIHGNRIQAASPNGSNITWQLFAILATDGFWDVVGNEEAADMVCEYLLSRLQRTARRLLQKISSSANIKDKDIDADSHNEQPNHLPAWMTLPMTQFSIAHVNEAEEEYNEEERISEAIRRQATEGERMEASVSEAGESEDANSNAKDDETAMVSLSKLLPMDAFQNAATLLAQEAWLRGSTDNIGVNIVNLHGVAAASPRA